MKDGIVLGFRLCCLPYAYNMLLYFAFSSTSRTALDVLNWHLEPAMGWIMANKLKLNPGKTKVLLVIWETN